MNAPTPGRPEYNTPAPVDVTQHLGLVHWVIRKRGFDRSVAHNANLDISDLEQAGTIGLLKAAERFDPARGCTFGTFATHWIRHHVGRLVANESATVRTPIFLQAKRRKAGEPMRIKVRSLDRSTGHRHGTIGSDEGNTFGDMLSYPEPEDDDTRECLPNGTSLESLIAGTPELSANEVRVLRGRAEDLTLKDIGLEIGISRERARQLEVSAMVKIRRAQGLEVDDGLVERHARLRMSSRSRRANAGQGALPAQNVELQDVEREVASLRGQGLGLRAVGKRVGISGYAVQAIERKLLARLAAALETAA